MKKRVVFGRLEIISFVTGFVLLAYELIAARIMAPSIGSSTYVWTSVIGVIIAALSLGYVVGGKLADARKRSLDVVWLVLLAAILIALTRVSYSAILGDIAAMDADARVQAVIAATLLFAPASFVLGAISPYLVKLKLTSLAESGQSVAGLSATNSIGGIAGTFVTGFILFGFVGLQESLTLLIISLIIVSWLLVPKERLGVRVGTVLVLIILGSISASQTQTVSVDTPSAHYSILPQASYGGKPATFLVTGPTGIQSAVYNQYPDELVFWYAKQIALVADQTRPESILILGGGAYTLPQYFADKYPESTIDVVEIDPELEAISEEYFQYQSPDNVTSIAMDARTYVERADKKYQLIVVDVYGDTSIPPSLMTVEFGQALGKLTTEDGIVAVNLIAGLEGECREVFVAADNVYRPQFEHAVYAGSPAARDGRGNFIIAYSAQPLELNGFSNLEPLGGEGYSDNFIPAERLFYDCLNS